MSSSSTLKSKRSRLCSDVGVITYQSSTESKLAIRKRLFPTHLLLYEMHANCVLNVL